MEVTSSKIIMSGFVHSSEPRFTVTMRWMQAASVLFLRKMMCLRPQWTQLAVNIYQIFWTVASASIFSLLFFIELIGVTLVNKIPQVSGVRFCDRSSVYCIACSAPEVSFHLSLPCFPDCFRALLQKHQETVILYTGGRGFCLFFFFFFFFFRSHVFSQRFLSWTSWDGNCKRHYFWTFEHCFSFSQRSLHMIDRRINQTHLRDENPRLKAAGRGSPGYSSVRRNSRN